MYEFLQSRFDYIYFLYGLSFMFLGICTTLIAREKKTNLPWFYLSAFAFLHSINEWMEMVKINIGDNSYSNFVRLFFLLFS